MDKKVNLFLDSGAFSAWSKGVEIDIEKYISFIKENEKYIDYYSVLDSIGDPALTLQNQKIMEQAGLSPIPCFHYGEPIEYLQKYIEKYNYIALGGMVPISTTNLIDWLDYLFSDFICNKEGIPRVKIHGFGMTSLSLMLRYPWFSVDSTSWVLTGRFGGVFVPKKRNGKYIYIEQPFKVNISNRSSSNKDEGQHFTTYSLFEQQIILDYFKERGFSIGKSEYRNEKKSQYKLKENERWINEENIQSRKNLINTSSEQLEISNVVEIIVEPGLCNDYKQRDELNIIYFLDLQDNLPSWPWPFKIKKQKGFGFK